MNILLNSKEVTLQEGATLQQLIQEANLPTQNIAIAVNNALILRDNWSQTILNNGDNVVAIAAAYGG